MALGSRFAPRVDQPTNRPTLQAVLDYYGWDYNPARVKQMVACLFHDDRHPSLSLNLEKQGWKCHSCGEKGNVWRLIEIKEGTDFDGARAFAAEQRLAEGSDGGSDFALSGERAGGGALSRRAGTDGGQRAYVPSWRRNRSDAGA